MSHLQDNYPEYHEFLQWHKNRVFNLYVPNIALELYSVARSWVCKEIRREVVKL